MPSDAAPGTGPAPAPAPAPALEDPTTLPLPPLQTLGTAASRTPLHSHQQPVGVTQTPLEASRQVKLPATDTGSGGAAAWLQHDALDRQRAQHNVKDVPSETSLPPFTAQKGFITGQKAPFGASQAPASTRKGTSSGQKRPASRQSLLDTAQPVKHSKQTTLDTGLKETLTAVGQRHRSAEGQSAGSNRQTPSGLGLAPPRWSISKQTPGSTGAAQHAQRAGVSPHNNVAQVLDLTQVDEEPATSAQTDPHAGSEPPHVQPSVRFTTGSISTDRRNSLPSHNASSPRKTASVVDLT